MLIETRGPSYYEYDTKMILLFFSLPLYVYRLSKSSLFKIPTYEKAALKKRQTKKGIRQKVERYSAHRRHYKMTYVAFHPGISPL